MSNKRIWALMCGSARIEFELYTMVAALCLYRQRGELEGIVWSTWNGEPDKFQGLRERLKTLQIDIVETLFPDSVGEIHPSFYYQATQINAGLDYLPDNVWVIKCRTDYCLNRFNRVMPRLITLTPGELAVRPLGCFQPVLQYKIVNLSPFVAIPFQFFDVCFGAYKADMRKMADIRGYRRLCHFDVPPDIAFFVNSFYYCSPILGKFFSVFGSYDHLMKSFPKLLKPEDTAYDSISEYALPRFLNCFLALFFIICYTHFDIPPAVEKPTKKMMFIDVFNNRGTKDKWSLFANFSRERINEVVSGEILPSVGYNLMYREIVRIMSIPNYAQNISLTEADNMEWQEFAKSRGVKLNKSESNQYTSTDSKITYSYAVDELFFKEKYNPDKTEFARILKTCILSEKYQNLLYKHYKKFSSIDIEFEIPISLAILRDKSKLLHQASDVRLFLFRALWKDELPQSVVAQIEEGFLIKFQSRMCKSCYIKNADYIASAFYLIKYFQDKAEKYLPNAKIYCTEFARWLDIPLIAHGGGDWAESFVGLADSYLRLEPVPDLGKAAIVRKFLQIIADDGQEH